MKTRFSARLAVFASLSIALALPAFARGPETSKFKEEFHQTYPLAAGGRVELSNINGAVHITAWDQNQVKVDAVKYANSQERLNEAQIKVSADAGSVSVKTQYPHHDMTFNNDDDDNPAGVEYTLMVPRSARLDKIETVNGSLDLTGVTGEVRAETVNGHMTARGLAGRTHLETVNGRMEAQFDRLDSSSIDLSSVNGSMRVTLPSNANANIEASTIHGGVENDFGMPVDSHWFSHTLHSQLGSGGPHIKLENVNGRIQILRADGSQATSSVQNLDDSHHSSKSGKDDDDDDDDDNETRSDP
ncbi:MAG: hypothetical protein H0X25_22760 [Acidobacteriales bacterium]|nr:hypothetical protein [Terriglobales bacterium]